MKKLFAFLFILFFGFSLFAQNILIQGRIISDEDKKPVSFAKVIRTDSLTDVSSDESGFFKLRVPVGETISLIFSHPNFQLQTINVTPGLHKSPLLVKMVPSARTIAIRDKSKYKNMLAFAPVELFFLGLTFQYERLLKGKHAVGGYATALLHRRFWMFNDNTSLTGIKVEPFYRYYAWKNNRYGGFGQVKLTYATFTIHDDDAYNTVKETPAQAFGIGISWGWKIYHSKIKRHTIELVIGAKFVPVVTNQDLADAIRDFNMEYWWGGLGPGSVFDIKFTLGGVF